jgi:hypothetical protein
MASTISVAGRDVKRPVTAVTVQALNGNIGVTPDPDRIVALIGDAESGVPGQVYQVTDPNQLDALFRSGDLYIAAKQAFQPSTSSTLRPVALYCVNTKPGNRAARAVLGSGAAVTVTAGAGSTLTSLVSTGITGALVGTALPAKTILSFASGATVVQLLADLPIAGATVAIRTISGPAVVAASTSSVIEPAFVLESTGYRDPANQLYLELSGNLTSGYSVALKNQITGEKLNTTPRIGLALSLKYTGGAAGVKTVSVVNVGGQRYLQTTIAAAPLESVSIGLGGLTIASLVSALNSLGVYQANISRDGALTADSIDLASAVDISVQGQLTAIKPDLKKFFTYGSGAAYATYIEGGATTIASPQVGYFSGGNTPVQTTPEQAQSWATATDNLAPFDFAEMVPLTEDSALKSGVVAANAARSDIFVARFSHVWLGIPASLLPSDDRNATQVATYISNVLAYTQANNDPRIRVVASVGDVIDPITKLPRRCAPWESAVKGAALRASFGPGEPLTNKYVSLTNPFPRLSFDNSGTLTVGGAIVFEIAGANGPTKIVRGVTAYTGVDNPVYESETGMAIVDSIGRSQKQLMDAMIPGQKATAAQLQAYSREARRMYDNFKAREWIQAGIDANGAKVGAYTFTLLGTSYQGRLVRSSSLVNPVLEFVAGEHQITAQAVEIVLGQ